MLITSSVYCVHQVERLHYLLKVFVETARRGEPVDGRLIQHLLSNPSNDGGQWQMLVNLVNKYGVVPKKCFADAWSSENSRRLCIIANNKVDTARCIAMATCQSLYTVFQKTTPLLFLQ